MKTISHTKLSETLAITEQKDGFWLYDDVKGMNLAMRAASRDDAFTEALTYYQKRLVERESDLRDLKSKVESFVGQFVEEDLW